MNELILSERMPVLAMRGLVLFPQATMHFDVGREKSVRALEAAMNADQHIFLVTQKKIEQDDPGFGDLYEIGTVAHVLQVLKIPGDTVRVLVQGEYRARATQMLQTAPCMMARVDPRGGDTEHYAAHGGPASAGHRAVRRICGAVAAPDAGHHAPFAVRKGSRLCGRHDGAGGIL